MHLRVLDRAEAWIALREPAEGLVRFRQVFAAIWLVYDVLDLATSGSALDASWGYAVVGVPRALQALQLGLILDGLALLLGLQVQRALAAQVVLRGIETAVFFKLNDFYHVLVTALILLTVDPAALEGRAPAPRWVRDVLRFQTAWMYLATGVLKLSPQWLSGAHLHVRLGFLSPLGWPYPPLFKRCAESLSCDAVLAAGGVTAELFLALVLFSGRWRAVALMLAAGIHGFGALATNVWFFGPSMLAQVWFATRKPRPTSLPDPLVR